MGKVGISQLILFLFLVFLLFGDVAFIKKKIRKFQNKLKHNQKNNS